MAKHMHYLSYQVLKSPKWQSIRHCVRIYQEKGDYMFHLLDIRPILKCVRQRVNGQNGQ